MILRSLKFQFNLQLLTLKGVGTIILLTFFCFSLLGEKALLFCILASTIYSVILPLSLGMNSYSVYHNMALSMGDTRKTFFLSNQIFIPVILLFSLSPLLVMMWLFPALHTLNLQSLLLPFLCCMIATFSIGELLGILTAYFGKLVTIAFGLIIGIFSGGISFVVSLNLHDVIANSADLSTLLPPFLFQVNPFVFIIPAILVSLVCTLTTYLMSRKICVK